MNIRDLTYFLAVAELEHFGHAAKQCFVSQPTLSGQIKKLEEELGVKLFERTNRRVLLTDPGEQIAASARKILHEIETIHDIAESCNDPLAGKFRLGAFPTLATYIFPELVSDLMQQAPSLRLILIEEKTAVLLEKLRHGEIDAALLALPIVDDFLVSEPLFDDEFYLAIPPSHDLASIDKVDLSMLRKYPLLLLEEGHCLRDHALDVCTMHGIGEDQDVRATGLETLRQMVKAGTGITLMPKTAVRSQDNGINYVPFSNPAPYRSIGLVWRKTSSRLALIKTIADLVRKNFAESEKNSWDEE